MDESEARLHDRRAFMRTLSRGMFAAASLGGAGQTLMPSAGGSPAALSEWDLSWVDRLKGPHRSVLDSNDLADGTAIINAFVLLAGFQEVYPGADVSTVLVMRGRGVHMAFGGAAWEKFGLGGELNVAGTGNPYAVQLAVLRGKGVVLLACSLATAFYASEIGRRMGTDARAVESELKATLVPGVMLVPSGVFAVVRAQEAGCHLVKSS